MNKIPLLVITGPTASGKTDLSIKLAVHFRGEIISADSMQIYRGMDIGTAKVTEDEKQGIPHHLIDIINPNENFSVAKYSELAKERINMVFNNGKLPIMAGGTGLYINSVLENISFGEFSEDTDYREHLRSLANEKGGSALKEMLFKVDPLSAERLHQNDINRLIRALEVYKVTGKTITDWNKESKKDETPFDSLIIGLTFENRQSLYERINKRVDIMLQNGLVDEVNGLLESGVNENCTAMQAIGYKEIVKYFNNQISLDEAVEIIKRESRRYAKRQLTWLRRNKNIKWIYADKENNTSNIFEKAKIIVENYYKL